MKKSFSLMIVFALVLSMAFVAADVTPQPDIKVTLLNQDPDPVKQGDVVEVRFKIENEGVATIDNLQVQVVPDFPFSLYSGSLIKDIGKMRAAQSGADAAIVDFKLLVDEDAVEGDNEIELRVRIDGGLWQSYDNDDFFIDVEDYDFPEIEVYVKESDIKNAGQKGEVVIEIANTNLEDVKFMQVNLMPSADYELLSTSNYVYIGDVDSDDTESETFDIYVEPKIEGFLMLPVQLEYQDTNEKEYKKDYMLKLRLFNKEESKKFGFAKSSRAGLGVVVVLVLGIAYYIYRRRKKKR